MSIFNEGNDVQTRGNYDQIHDIEQEFDINYNDEFESPFKIH